jgi:CheY-like chemotaxis protein
MRGRDDISEVDMKQLFESLFSAKIWGIGLGLAICRQLAEMMGGRIWVQSELDRGSTFHVTFAAEVIAGQVEPAESCARGEPEVDAGAHAPGRQEPPAHPLRILLAEDNQVNQRVTLHILKRLGYQADLAENGREVLAALERQAYDVILMDVQMPEMDGVEATRRIRSDLPAGRQPRIVALTAYLDHRGEPGTRSVSESEVVCG